MRLTVSKLSRFMLRGLFIVLPIVITIELVRWVFMTVEGWLSPSLETFVPPHWYIPGMALIAFLLICVLIGFSAYSRRGARLWRIPGRVLAAIPGINKIYGIIQDLFEVMSGENFEDESVVMVKLPNSEVELIGIVTKKGTEQNDRIADLLGEEQLAVFLPMAYNVGGYMIMVPKSCTRNLDMKPAEALQLVLSGGLGSKKAPDTSVK
ncbi:DUF502 domain-containing protein [Aliidiomarina maris]|uniref:Putative membrane protein n=1 Tax=Aliidiomarina maris TaxID=531312 RepID=A0A327X1T5_9GAMM|nr:DUF502 domain-containing protein [Aliidiomarina maris]RAJ96403.1 putative membrane protein [Aliidiomarina maris]RUO22822.1 hypothetical protein CWE07_10095 [Aliidiomarina maris]